MDEHVLFERKLGVKDLPLYVLLYMHPCNCGPVWLKPCDNKERLIPGAEEIKFSWHDFLERYGPAKTEQSNKLAKQKSRGEFLPLLFFYFY